ncbi:hypothetical protein GCM10023144_05370 [Pigmentiphaga soli]|uniref:Uncharacterized protein n=1 Tax=Pigmentiphaga soli TaxID=1007095 RepID=A0ABP8GHB1_9BURK
MAESQNIATLITSFRSRYDAQEKDQVWQRLSHKMRIFWQERILSGTPGPLGEAECDEIIRILDRNGKGNTKNDEAVARVMVPQGAWRRMLNEFHDNPALGRLVHAVLNETDDRQKAALIDELYRKNQGQKNNLTGPSGNTIGAFLAAYDPVDNLSIISLKDRRAVIEFLGLSTSFEWDAPSIGTRIVESNRIIIQSMHRLGLPGSARTIGVFFYTPEVQALWKGEDTIKRTDKTAVSVVVPTTLDEEEEEVSADSVRESMRVQGLVAKIGETLGFRIWLPRADRSRVLKVWHPEPDVLLDDLPLNYDSSTMKTVEQIDVLWLRKRSIVRAFEVEHTTSVYSGLLRMADLVALQPNISLKLHIVAPVEKREKVLQEIMRPVFSLLEGRALKDMCTYLSYDHIRDIGELKHLGRMSDEIIEDYEEMAE